MARKSKASPQGLRVSGPVAPVETRNLLDGLAPGLHDTVRWLAGGDLRRVTIMSHNRALVDASPALCERFRRAEMHTPESIALTRRWEDDRG